MRSEGIPTQEVPYKFIFVCVGLFALGLAFSIFNLFIVGMPSEASLISTFHSERDSAPAVASRDMSSDNPALPQIPAELAQGKVFRIETPDQNSFIAVFIDEEGSGELIFQRSFSGWRTITGSLGGPNRFTQSETLVFRPITSFFPNYYGILGWRTNNEAQKVRLRYEDLSQSTHRIEEESFVIGDFGKHSICAIDVLDAQDELIEQLQVGNTPCSEG
jgi:hypothetical protein